MMTHLRQQRTRTAPSLLPPLLLYRRAIERQVNENPIEIAPSFRSTQRRIRSGAYPF